MQASVIRAGESGNPGIRESGRTELPVFVFGGQSNMVGLGIASELSPDYWVQPGIIFYYDSVPFLRPYEASKVPYIGPEVSAGKALSANISAVPALIMVKFAVGGSNLAKEWNPTYSGSYYATLRDRVKNTLLEAPNLSPNTVRVKAFFWMQGESDATDYHMATDYETNLRNLIATVRKDFNDPALPFIMGEMTHIDHLPPQFANFLPYGDIVLQAQKNVAASVPNVRLFKTDDISVGKGGLHYSTLGLIELGKRFAAAYSSLGVTRLPRRRFTRPLVSANPRPHTECCADTAARIRAGHGRR